MRAEVDAVDDYNRWWPETLLYIGHFNSPFEIFARSVSKTYFNKVKVLLGIEIPKDLELLLKSYKDGTRKLPMWQFEGFNPTALLGYENLATLP